jgi:Cobyric acid synthase
MKNLHGYLENLSNKEVNGYEIHMGVTKRNENSENFVTLKEKLGEKVTYEVGSVNKDSNVFGTYLHGIFDNIDFTRTLLNNIRVSKGLEPIESYVKSFEEFKNQEYDKLADFLREHLDIEKIYEIMNSNN